MEFELHGVKFNYEYGNVYQCYHLKKGDVWKERKMKLNGRGYKWFRFDVNKKKYCFSLHRIVYWLHNRDWDILDSSHHNSIDHINGIRGDNRIENLRNVTCQKNSFNRTKAKGYCWDKTRNKWKTAIKVNGKNINLGRFELEEDARQAYLDAKKIYHII